MKSRYILVLVALSITFCTQKKDEVVATVGEYTVDFHSYKKRFQEYLNNSVAKDNLVVRKQIAQNMVHEIMLSKYDDNTAIEDNTEYRHEQAWAKKEMILGYLKDQQVYAKIKVTDTEVREAYNRSKDKIAARHLYAPTLARARELYREIKDGASWDSLAAQVFTDSTLKSNGGYLGYFSGGDMDPAFEDAAFRLKINEVSKPVKTAQGYSIIKVEDKKPYPLITENEYLNHKSAQTRLLRISKKAAYESKFITSVFDKDAVNFSPPGLKDVFKSLHRFPKNTEKLDEKKWVLEYKGRKWNEREAIQKINQVPEFHRGKIDDISDLQTLLKSLLLQDILLNKAHDLGYENAPIVKKAEKNARMHVFLKYKIRQILDGYTSSDSALYRYYNAHLEAFNKPRKLNVLEILTGSFKKGLDIKARILKGEPFGSLARKYSLRKWSAVRNGEIGLSDWNRFGMLRNRLWRAPLNKVIGPVKSGPYYGLFKVIKKIEARPAPFDEVRQKVDLMYKKVNEQSIVFNYLGNIYKNVKVSYNNKLLRYFTLE